LGVGKRIHKLRMQKGLLIRDVCEKAEIDMGALSKIERELVDPRVGTVAKIAKALGVPVTLLIEENNATNEDEMAANMFRTLDEEDKKEVLEYLWFKLMKKGFKNGYPKNFGNE